MSLVVSLALVACTSTPRSTAVSTLPAAAPPGAVALAPGHRLVVLEHDGTWLECSARGGEHATFAVGGHQDRRILYVHAGGTGHALGGAATAGWYVADVRLDGALRRQPAGRCLDDVPGTIGEVVRLWRAGSEADAHALAAAPPARLPDYEALSTAAP